MIIDGTAEDELTPVPDEPAPDPARMTWMDLLRGVAILLVLVWHCAAVPVLYGIDMPGWLRAANDTLLPFRMPTLMFLSGMLLPRALAKPLPTYLDGKLRLVVWPYLLWSALHIALYGSPAPVWHPNAWIGTGYLWFLFFIACYYLGAPFIRWAPAWLVPVVAFAASIPIEPGRWNNFFYFAGFFFTGNLVARRPELLAVVLDRRWSIAVCGGVAGALGALSAVSDTKYNALFAVGSLAGIAAAIAGAQRVQSWVVLAPVVRVGRNSLVFYASHFPVMILVITVLGFFGVDHVGVIAPVDLVAALVVGGLLVRFRHSAAIRWMFEPPWPVLATILVRRRRRARDAATAGPDRTPSVTDQAGQVGLSGGVTRQP